MNLVELDNTFEHIFHDRSHDNDREFFGEISALIEWLGYNRPIDLVQLEDLQRILIECRFHEEVWGDYYSSEMHGELIYLFAWTKILIVSSMRSIDYMLYLTETIEADLKQEIAA